MIFHVSNLNVRVPYHPLASIWCKLWEDSICEWPLTIYHIISLPISFLSWLRFVSWSSPPPSAKNPSEDRQIFTIFQVISKRKSLRTLNRFLNFSVVCFHWQISWNLKKFKTERVSNWIGAQCSCLGFPSFIIAPCLPPKTTDKLLF